MLNNVPCAAVACVIPITVELEELRYEIAVGDSCATNDASRRLR
jgi:hypothetical protein